MRIEFSGGKTTRVWVREKLDSRSIPINSHSILVNSSQFSLLKFLDSPRLKKIHGKINECIFCLLLSSKTKWKAVFMRFIALCEEKYSYCELSILRFRLGYFICFFIVPLREKLK